MPGETLSAPALCHAMASDAPFRIGGDGPAPGAQPVPSFETLTSGSTSAPRRLIRSHGSWIASFVVNARAFGIGPGARVAVLGRLSQSLALYAGVEALHMGAEAHLLDDLRPNGQRAALLARRITALYATPAQLRLLVEAKGEVLPDLRYIIIGGSKLDAGLRIALRALAPQAKVVEFYGAAEASFITMADAATPDASVGRLYPAVDLRLADASGQTVADGEVGQIWVRSPYLFTGYAAGQGVGATVWDGDWLSVGETGLMQAGYLYLKGRAGRMVTIADQNVWPEEMETFLLSQPGVRRAAVLPRPDALRGVHLVAVVVGDAGQESALRAACLQAFGPLKSPRAFHWRTDWPSLPSGKTDLAALMRGLE